jgi:phosphoribosylglycinamide formyltransferase-1
MVFVGSDNPEAKGLGRGVKHRIPTFVVNYKSIIQDYKNAPDQAVLPDDLDLNAMIERQNLFSGNASPEKIRSFIITRAVAEARLLEEIKPYNPDLIVLAGFMRNLTPYFINKINKTPGEYRIMNIHPAILPSFPGVDGYGDTFRYGCKVGGCTVHFIDYGEDSGPIIGQKTFKIKENDTLDSVREKGLKLEWELYPECIQLFAQGRLKTVKMSYTFKNNKTYQRSVVKIAQQE